MACAQKAAPSSSLSEVGWSVCLSAPFAYCRSVTGGSRDHPLTQVSAGFGVSGDKS